MVFIEMCATFWNELGPWPLPFHTLSLWLAGLDMNGVALFLCDSGSSSRPPQPHLRWHKRAFSLTHERSLLSSHLSLAGALDSWWPQLGLRLLLCGMRPTVPFPCHPKQGCNCLPDILTDTPILPFDVFRALQAHCTHAGPPGGPQTLFPTIWNIF